MYPLLRGRPVREAGGEPFRRVRLSTLVLLVALPPVSGHWGEVGRLDCASVLDRLARGC